MGGVKTRRVQLSAQRTVQQKAIAQRRQRQSSNSAGDQHRGGAGKRGVMASGKVAGKSPKVQAIQRKWDDPIWAIQGPGDAAPAGTDSFDVRARRVEEMCRARWPADGSEQPPHRSQCEMQLRECKGHAGRAVAALLPPTAGSTVSFEAPKDSDAPVLPEFMVQKISDLGTQLEAQQRESEEIRRKFLMIDKSADGGIDEKEFGGLLDQLGIQLTKEEQVAEFAKIDANGDKQIDIAEFEEWMHELLRRDAKYARGLHKIGHKTGWAKIKVPALKDKDRSSSGKPTRTQKFLAPNAKKKKLRPSVKYWIEVIGSRLSIYDSDDKVEELARLQLSDPEVESVREEVRVAEGWDEGGGTEKKGALMGAVNTATAGFNTATAGLLASNHDHPTVIALWLRPGHEDRYRVAIDIQGVGNKDESSVNSWVEAVRSGLSYQGGRRGAKQLWDSLAKRLKLVVQLQSQYGDIRDMYGTTTSEYDEVSIPRYIRDPDSYFSAFWDLMQLIMLLLVCWYVPLRTGFEISVDLWTYEFWQDAVIDVYFVFDIIIQFRTAYWDRSGVLVVDTSEIRKNYLCGWFLIDFICVLPLGYIGYFVNDDGSGDAGRFRAVKSLRLLRMGKMMRLAKVYKMLQKYDSVAELKPLIAIFGLVFLVALAAHLLACFWFLIGVNDQVMLEKPGDPPESVVLEGWVNQKANEDDWWGVKGQNATLKTRYVTSMYGIFNALENGYTDDEKLFAICAELIVGSVIYGGLAAVLSAAMMESQQASEEFNTNYKKLKTWMTSRKLKSSYQQMVLKAYSHKFKDSTAFDEDKLLADLPPAMASALMDKLYGQFIADVPYFRGLDKVIIIKLASSTKPLTAAKESLIMEEGKVGHEMFILIDGEVMVEKQGIELGYFKKQGSFFGENPVVDPRGAERRTRSVKAVTDCFLIYLDRDAITDIADAYPELKARLRRFQRLGLRRRRERNESSLADRNDNDSQGVTDDQTGKGSDDSDTMQALQTRVENLEDMMADRFDNLDRLIQSLTTASANPNSSASEESRPKSKDRGLKSVSPRPGTPTRVSSRVTAVRKSPRGTTTLQAATLLGAAPRSVSSAAANASTSGV